MTLRRISSLHVLLCIATCSFSSAFNVIEHLPRPHQSLPGTTSSSRADFSHIDQDDNVVTPKNTRRTVLSHLAAVALAPLSLVIGTSGIDGSCWAATTTSTATSSSLSPPSQRAESSQLDVGLLEARVTENVLSPPPYGMETSDIFYPSWFQGTWRVSSKTVDVQAPCGIPLFGGNATWERTRNDIGTTLTYEARFVVDGNNGQIIADREYNVNSIAKAAMGQYSVIDIPIASPNKLSCVLVPKGSSQMLRVDLIALNRRQETISEVRFDCSEVIREIIAPVNSNSNGNSNNTNNNAAASNSAPILKEVETTSLYSYDPTKKEIRCQQRSATFLLPSQTSAIAYKMWEAARGRPIDTRFYNVLYTRVDGA